MPTLTIRCKCGATFEVDAKDSGRRIRCRRCGRVGNVGRPRHGIWNKLDQFRHTSARALAPVTSALPAFLVPDFLKPAGRHARHRAPQSPLISTLTLLSWSYLAAVSCIAMTLWTLGDRWWPATVLLFIGRWIFLVPLIVLLPAAAILRRSLLKPLLIGALIVVGPIMGFHTGWARLVPHGDGLPFRVVTFNADGGNQIIMELPALLDEWQPDVVALQECGAPLAEEIQQMTTWYHHSVRGLCLISRYPINSANVMDRSALERVKEDEAAGIGGSGDVARYTIMTPNGPVSFTNLHLETPRKGLEQMEPFNIRPLRQNTTLRDIESHLARRWVDQGRAPPLVAGDFNTPAESRIFQEHWGDFSDAFSSAGFGLGMTRYNGWIRVRIDHILLGEGWHANHVVVGRDLGSDHRPVIADLTLLKRR